MSLELEIMMLHKISVSYDLNSSTLTYPRRSHKEGQYIINLVFMLPVSRLVVSPKRMFEIAGAV